MKVMNLKIQFKEKWNPFELSEMITDYIIQQNKIKKLEERELRTWEAANVTLNNREKTKIIGFKNSGQFYKMGWTRMVAYKDRMQVYYVQNNKGEKTSEEQKAIVLCRFAAMLRNHFGKYIYSISLNGL